MTIPRSEADAPRSEEALEVDKRVSRLTHRQKECLGLVAQGYTSKQIGRRLGLSYSTVDNHLLAAVQCLGVEGRAEAGRLLRQRDQVAGQSLPRQPPTLAEPDPLADDLPAITKESGPGWLHNLVPPIGGQENDLTTSKRLFAIGRIAVFSVLVFVACVIVIRVCFTALS